MLKQNQKIQGVGGPGAAAQSESRLLVAALLASGARLADDSPLADLAEEDDKAPDGIKRSHCWAFDVGHKIEFRQMPVRHESIEVADLVARFQDDEWIKRNPHHPIAYMRAFAIQLRGINAALKDRPFLKKIMHHEGEGAMGYSLIPSNATPEEAEQIQREMREASNEPLSE